jgi:SAM-dependent methyltransferase
MTAAASARRYWSQHGGYKPSWYSFCARYIQERVTGDPDMPITPWMYRRFCPALPTEHVLMLGCLEGDSAAFLVRKRFAKRVTGTDIAEEAIERGRKKNGSRVDFFVADLNSPELPGGPYSVVQADGVLHHIQNLEAGAQAIYDVLRPGGWLFAGDFTGPSRYRYSRKEVRLINEGISLLPPELRGPPFDPEHLASKLREDPSESIRTRDIEAVLRATFDGVEVRPFGGNVLQRALGARFFKAFDAGNPAHVAAVDRLIEMDRAVSASEPSHNQYVFAQRGQRLGLGQPATLIAKLFRRRLLA